jgi:hypothetical protein
MRKGINYDVGTETFGYLSRPSFDDGAVRSDLKVIKSELHCDSVRISGTRPDRLLKAAELALDLGLEVWLSPTLHDHSPEDTLAYTTECATAAQRLNHPDLIYLLGGELTIFMQGIIKGDTLVERLRPDRMVRLRYLGSHNKPLNAFLARANTAVRAVFQGPVSYASAPIEAVDWSPFDYVCLDYYRGRRNRDDFGQRLERHFTHGKPVVITEVGCCTYRGAEDKGGRAWDIVDHRDPDRLAGTYVRDEALQATEVMDMVQILEGKGVAGTFVFTFSAPALVHRENPARDLDMASYGLVKCYDDGHWEPKRLFHALAEHYG